jgi:2-dehydro-3-deoxyphosphogluconate aldolase/(4S)-4-hydroxy-2-oxoglutarate aldolase
MISNFGEAGKLGAIAATVTTGILPAIKLKQQMDLLPYVRAMYEGGARAIEITVTTPGVFKTFESITAEFSERLYLAAGTVLDAATARTAILAGARIIVSPAVVPEVIATANRYGVACYSGAFTATECLAAMQAGADMVKIFPASLGGPKYMTNLRMVYPNVKLIPSGGICLDTAPEYIRCGATAISGARQFFDPGLAASSGLSSVTEQIARYIKAVADAKAEALELP